MNKDILPAHPQKSEIKYRFHRCKICDGTIGILKYKTVDGLTLAKCKNCGLMFVSSIPVSKMWAEDSFEKTIDYYAEVVSSESSKFHYGLNKILNYLSTIGQKVIINNLSLLDVGCGNGEFLLMCREKGFYVAGAEQSKSATEICMQKGLNNIYTKDLDDIHETFDVITLFDVAEHLEDPRSFFIKIWDKLKPKGIIYIETPRRSIIDVYLNILGLFTTIKNNRISREHVQLFSNKSLFILLESSGFNIVSFERRQSLSWGNKKQYIYNLGVRSLVISTYLEKVANFFIKINMLGRNKAIILANKNE